MNIKKPVEQVIKKIAPASVDTLKSNLDTERHKIVTVGKDGNVIPEKRSKFKSLFTKSSKSDLTHYLVSPNIDSDLIDTTCILSNQMEGQSINIKITYQINCDAGLEEQMVEALHKGSSPENRLTTLLKDWIRNFEKKLRLKDDTLINSFFLQKHELEDYLKTQLRENIYLRSNLKLELVDDGIEEKIKIDSRPFSIQLADFKKNIILQFKTTVKIAGRNPIKAYTNKISSSKIERLLQNKIIAYCKSISIQQWILFLSSKDQEDLVDNLNKELSHYGRQINELSLLPEEKILDILNKKTEEGDFKHTITDRANNEELTLKVIYDFKPLPNRVPDVIKALFNTDTGIKFKFKQFLTRKIQGFYEKKQELGIDIFASFLDLINDLKLELEQSIEHQLGLKTRLVLKLVGEADLSNKNITSDKFFARTQDFDDPLQFSFEAEFGINPSNKIKALSKAWSPTRIEANIVDRIKLELREFIQLHELYRDPDSISKRMIPFVEKIVKLYGRKVNFFRLQRLSDLEVIEQENHDIKVVCRIKDYSRTITVENRLILKLRDLGTFHSKNIKNLKEWIQTTLDHIVQAELFKKNYVQVLTQIDEIEKNIKKEIDEKVEEIGYSINQHLVTPNLEHLKLKTEGFKIDRELDIPTKNHRVTARLQLIIRGEIRDLSKLARYLNVNPDEDIKEKIADAAISIIDRKIHETSPERYYMRFESKSDDENASLRRELIDEITERLSSTEEDKTFGLNEGFKITIKPLETSFVKRFDEIQAKRYTVEIKAMSLVDQDRASFVRFHVPFSVRSVNEFGWHIFQAKSSQLTIEEQVKNLENVLRDELTRKLQVLPLDTLQYDDYKTLQRIQSAIVNPSTEIVAIECGLNISVEQFQRVLSKEELEELEQVRKLTARQRRSDLDMAEVLYNNRGEELKILLEQKKTLLKNLDPNDPELLEVDQKIKAIAPELPEARVSHKKKKSKKKKKKKTSLDDFLPPPSTKRNLSEGVSKKDSGNLENEDDIEEATIIDD